jgi:3-hydroxyisobutyrate dehydrogenase
MSDESAWIGFIGIGNMGNPMAANVLARGFRLVVHDLQRHLAYPLEERGAEWADSIAHVARRASVVCISLPGPEQVAAVVAGADGLVSSMHAGSLLIDFTTNSPLLVRELHQALLARGVAMIDAPVSGGVTGASSRKLTVQVGGAHKDVERARPLLDAVAETILHVGAIGAGSTCKVLHNCAVFCSNLAAVECLTAGIKAGIDPKTLIEVFQKSGLGRNHDLNVALPARLFQGDFAPHFAMKTALKDMALATELARAYDVPMPLAERCALDMAEAVARGWGDRDDNIYLTLQEERAGVAVRLNGSSQRQAEWPVSLEASDGTEKEVSR